MPKQMSTRDTNMHNKTSPANMYYCSHTLLKLVGDQKYIREFIIKLENSRLDLRIVISVQITYFLERLMSIATKLN